MTYCFQTKIAILLSDIGLGQQIITFAMDKIKEPGDVEKHKNEIVKSFGEAVFIKLKNAISAENIEKSVSKLQKYGINAVSTADKDYPGQLKNIAGYPPVLYYKGDIKIAGGKCIAIVGTRKPTSYGREVTRYFAKELSEAGLVTVSGLAYGLDMEVADATLAANGKTIAVLGGGLDSIYPSQNSALADKIVENGGLLLSHYPPLKRPTKYSFLERNAVISGLSLGTIIVEAGEGSGTLNTATHAVEQGKELFVVPGQIFSPASVGSNKLIDQMPDTFTISPEHVLKVLKIEKVKTSLTEKKITDIKSEEKLIVEALYEGEKDFDTLKELTKIDSKSLISKLTMLEISGLIKKLPNNFYALASGK